MLMTTQQVADRLVELLRQGQFDTIYTELFHPTDIVHDEPQSEHFPHLVGVAAIREKDQAMQSNIAQFNGLTVGDAIVAGNHLALPYRAQFTLNDGTEVDLNELIVYRVRDGKIVLEKFFY